MQQSAFLRKKSMPAWLAGRRSGAGFVDHYFPDAFGLEDEFDEFAGGAVAAIGFGGVVRGASLDVVLLL
jgi:hypothetical protein